MTQSLVQEVERAIAASDASSREAMLLGLADLFAQNAEHLGEAQVAVFDNVMAKLVATVDSAARAALAETLADLANPPATVLRVLAQDADAGTAGPILMRARSLTEAELADCARQGSEAHLQAIALRSALSESLTDILLERGEAPTHRLLADNASAHFSHDGIARLAALAEADFEIRAALDRRGDLPSGSSTSAELSALHQAVAQVDAWLRSRGLSEPAESDIAGWLAENRVPEALAGLAKAARLAPELVLDAHGNAQDDPLVFLVRSVSFGWETCAAFLMSRGPRRPDPQSLRKAAEAFAALPVATAKRVVRFTSAREPLQKAG